MALDASGRTQFYLYRRAEPSFYAFDCIWIDGRDLDRRSVNLFQVGLRHGCLGHRADTDAPTRVNINIRTYSQVRAP